MEILAQVAGRLKSGESHPEERSVGGEVYYCSRCHRGVSFTNLSFDGVREACEIPPERRVCRELAVRVKGTGEEGPLVLVGEKFDLPREASSSTQYPICFVSCLLKV